MARQLPMATITREEFDLFRRSLPKATKEGVSATYHISQHSWYKLRDGKPVKQVTIERLRTRYHKIVGTQNGRASSVCD